MALLILGERAAGARYLFGALTAGGYPFFHVEADRALPTLPTAFAGFIFSDYPAHLLGEEAAAAIVRQVEAGAGLLMVGGWLSFGGRGAGYSRSPVGSLLPVLCQEDDDRVNTPAGLVLEARLPDHPILSGLPLASPPVVCGYNRVAVRPGATTVLNGRPLLFRSTGPALGEPVPLLVVGEAGRGRVAAFASDLLPHWCGGLVDWGEERLRLPTGAEVGAAYLRFVRQLVAWLLRQL